MGRPGRPANPAAPTSYRLIIGLLVIWLVLSIVGFAVKGLIWLAIIGLVLFVVTGVWGWVKRKANA